MTERFIDARFFGPLKLTKFAIKSFTGLKELGECFAGTADMWGTEVALVLSLWSEFTSVLNSLGLFGEFGLLGLCLLLTKTSSFSIMVNEYRNQNIARSKMSNSRKINQFGNGFAGCLSLAFLSSFTIGAENDEIREEVLCTKGFNRL